MAVHLLEQPDVDSLLASRVLEALAWARDRRAIDGFRAWRLTAPSWAKTLYIKPLAFTECGGWTLDDSGALRALCGEPCTELVASTETASTTRAFVASQSRCRCGRPLTLLLDASLPDTLLPWLRWPMPRLRVPLCDVCVCYETLFYKLASADDFIEVGERAQPDAWNAQDMPELQVEGLVLGGHRSPYHAADWLLAMRQSQVGGYPGWIQDAEYPRCPSCKDKMSFVAQVAHDEVEEQTEGTYYGFACASCRITAACYQQT